MNDLDLCYLSAGDAIGAFKTRKLSPVEVMTAQITRAEAVEPKINAFPTTFYERALDQARKAEAHYMKSGGRMRPLEGIPVAIKDETAIKGEITTYGSLIYKEHRDETDDPVVERLKRAGAIIHARTAVPEFGCATFTHSRLWGVTRNPWNPDYSPGGSSGGAGAALAAGTTTLADGSDTSGSIRIPASACGVVGYKPPYGRVPLSSPYNLDFYSHAGPMARTVGECRLLQNVIAGPHPKDIVSLRPKLRIPDRLGEIKSWRVAISMDLGYFEVDPEVVRNTETAIEVFRALGARVTYRRRASKVWSPSHCRNLWSYALSQPKCRPSRNVGKAAKDDACAVRAASRLLTNAAIRFGCGERLLFAQRPIWVCESEQSQRRTGSSAQQTLAMSHSSSATGKLC